MTCSCEGSPQVWPSACCGSPASSKQKHTESNTFGLITLWYVGVFLFCSLFFFTHSVLFFGTFNKNWTVEKWFNCSQLYIKPNVYVIRMFKMCQFCASVKCIYIFLVCKNLGPHQLENFSMNVFLFFCVCVCVFVFKLSEKVKLLISWASDVSSFFSLRWNLGAGVTDRGQRSPRKTMWPLTRLSGHLFKPPLIWELCAHPTDRPAEKIKVECSYAWVAGVCAAGGSAYQSQFFVQERD